MEVRFRETHKKLAKTRSKKRATEDELAKEQGSRREMEKELAKAKETMKNLECQELIKKEETYDIYADIYNTSILLQDPLPRAQCLVFGIIPIPWLAYPFL